MAKRRGLLTFLLLAGFGGCHEDRGLGYDILTHGTTIEMREVLECYRELEGGYPAGFGDLAAASLATKCPRAEEIQAVLRDRASDNVVSLWYSHKWTYSASMLDRRGRAQAYSLAVADLRGKPQYRSFWLDNSGIVRSSRGRAAGPQDVPEERQVAFLNHTSTPDPQ
jgi:hypothetical protein